MMVQPSTLLPWFTAAARICSLEWLSHKIVASKFEPSLESLAEGGGD
jgi:hypothetical protein